MGLWLISIVPSGLKGACRRSFRVRIVFVARIWIFWKTTPESESGLRLRTAEGDKLPGHIAAHIGGQEGNHRGDIFGSA